MTLTVSFLVALIGALVFALSSNGKASALGLAAFGAGLTAALIQLGPVLAVSVR